MTIQFMPCSSQIISERLPEIHKWLSAFSQTYNSFSNSLVLIFFIKEATMKTAELLPF